MKNSIVYGKLDKTQKLSRESGFTLIEIMVVVIVIAVVSVSVATTMGRSSDRSARLEAKRFMAIVNEVRDEAVIVGESFLLTMDEGSQSYQFARTRGASEGQAYDKLFKPRTIRDDVKLEWEVLEVFEEDAQAAPKVLISSLGEITPFEVRLGGDKNEYIVFVNDEGQLERREKPSRYF